jgi:uncharacterized protein YbjT (DUF2867 family)
MTDPSDRVFAVTGATGLQGGATVRALLGLGLTPRALVRDPSSAKARALSDLGAEVVLADFSDPVTLRQAFAGAEGIFAMALPTTVRGVEGEAADGRTIADAAQESGATVVYSSVGGAERHTGIPHFESKRRVEEYMTSLGLPVVFLRPVFFMDNFRRMDPQVEDGTLVLRMPMPGNVPLQMVAVADIGAAAAAILVDPDRITGGSIELAGDELTGEQIAAVIGEQRGVPARFEALPLEVLAGNPDQQAMFSWFANPPAYQADIAASRALVPSLHDLRSWLAEPVG